MMQGEVFDKESTVPPAERVLVSIATYKERDNLAPLIQEIHKVAPQVHVLVIDDNSPDGTGELADQLAADDPRIHVVHRAGKLGLGTAIIAGLRYAMENGFDLAFSMDADFSHHPRYLPAMIDGMDGRDVMIGSRYVPGGGTVNWPLSRKFMSWGVNVMCRLLLRLPAKDTSGGFRCYRTSLLRKVQLGAILSRGYSFQEEVLYHCRKAGARIGETPIVFEDRRVGTSKVNLKETARSLSLLLYLGILSTFGLDR